MIPEQLKGLRFNRVRFKEKRAFEPGWQNKPYTYEQIQNYFPQENYGVICGEDVRVLDDDSKDGKLMKLFLENFGETFRVRDHLYFKFRCGHAKKIIFEDDGEHLGEAQGENTYVVGPGSTHPSGEIYEQKNDLPIIEIDYNEFEKVFGKFMKKKEVKKSTTMRTLKDAALSFFNGDNINDIPISSIINLSDLNDVGNGAYQGSHPLHGSDGGMNFRVNIKDNAWFCFRDQSGGGPSELIAVMEGIISCRDAGPNCFTKEQAQEVIRVAREKYGLSAPKNDLGEPQGWAKSVSITGLADDHNFHNCPKCDALFDFIESHGFWSCKNCNIKGGLDKFARMIIERNRMKEKIKKAAMAL